MKKIQLLILLFIFTIIPCANAAETSEFVYENPDHQYSITLPSDWRRVSAGFVPPSGYPGLCILTSPYDVKIGPNTAELTENEANAIDKLMTENQYILQDKSYVKIANRNVLRVIYSKDEFYCIRYLSYDKEFSFQILVKGHLNQYNEDQKILDKILSTFTTIK